MCRSLQSIFYKSIPVLLIGMLLFSCKEDDTNDNKVDFDRKAMLENWAENIILPAIQNFDNQAASLQNAAEALDEQPDSSRLADLQSQFVATYIAFQKIKAFEVGPSENLSLRASLNTYPTDTQKVQENVTSGNYNLDQASNLTARGFPAMDYLLFGNSFDLLNEETARDYLLALSSDILSLSNQVNSGWTSYRTEFVNATGTDIGSSLGQVVNSINKDYELIKNAKIGFPAGKKTLGQPYPNTCEAYFSGISLELAEENIRSIHNFFRGMHYDGSQKGLSLQDYLQEMQIEQSGQALDQAIDEQFASAIEALEAIPGPLSAAVVQHKEEVDHAYLEIQKNVVLLKTDMPSALGVMITYQDNDGD